MHIQWIKDLGKVIPLRLRRSTKKARTQDSSTSRTPTGNEGDSSTPADISTGPFSSRTLPSNPSLMQPMSATREPDLEAPTNVSSGSSGGSLGREASDMAQLVLPLVQVIASAIPLVGAPMQAAIGGLLSCLQAIDRHHQNKAGLDSLTLRLNRLSCNLCNAPPANNPSEQSRRDSFVRMLQDTSVRVAALHERRLASTSVTQAIADCFVEIDRYLADYLLSSLLRNQDDLYSIREDVATLRRQREDDQKLLIASQCTINRIAALVGCVILVDATGHDHAIPVNFCTTFQQLNKMLHVLFQCDSVEAHIQRRYVDDGQYDLCIDDGKQVTRLTSHEWSNIAVGTKIVMRVIFEQETTTSSGFDYGCHFCGAVNHIAVESIMYSLERRAGCSIDCRKCKRRFQISREPPSAKQSAQSSNSKSTGANDEDLEMQLIRNFLVKQIVSHHADDTSVINETHTTFSCRWMSHGDNTICGFEGSLDALRMHIRSHLSDTRDVPVACHWEDCRQNRMQRDNVLRHVLEIHMGIKRWKRVV